MEQKKTKPAEQDVHAVEKDNQVQSNDGKTIANEDDLHEIEAGNIGETDAAKGMLQGPAIDLVSQPGGQTGG